MAVKICLLFVVMGALVLLSRLKPANGEASVQVDDSVDVVGLHDTLERSEKNTSISQDYTGKGSQAAKHTLDTKADSERLTTPHNADTIDYGYNYDEDEEPYNRHDHEDVSAKTVYDTKTEAESRVSLQKKDGESLLGIQEGGVTDLTVKVEGINDEHRDKNVTELKSNIGGGLPAIDDLKLDFTDDDSYDYAYETEPNFSVPSSINQEKPKDKDDVKYYDYEKKDDLQEFDLGNDKVTNTETDADILTTTLPDSVVAKLTKDANISQNISILNSDVAIKSEQISENSFSSETKEKSPFTVEKDVIRSKSQSPKLEVDASDEDKKFDEDDDANKESNQYEDVDGIDNINPAALTEHSNHDPFESDEDDYKVLNGIGITSVNDDYDQSYYPENEEGNAEEEVHLPVTTSWSEMDQKVNDHDAINKEIENDYWYDYGDKDDFELHLPMKDNAPATETNSQADAQDFDGEMGIEEDHSQKQLKGEMGIEEDHSLKQPQAPKSTIILYTVLIILLIAGIVVITIWKGPFKSLSRNHSLENAMNKTIKRRRSSSNLYLILQSDDDKKRLIDQPFV